MKPLIGLTTYAKDEKGHYTLPAEYSDAVRRAGGIPLLLPPGEESITQMLASLRGVVICGGGDISPALYNGEVHDTMYMVDEERDHSERAICKKILHCGIPTLGICRGLQMINIALGGDLHVHLEDVFGADLAHRTEPRDTVTHAVCIKKPSQLYDILQQTDVNVLSWHHQCVARLGTGLHITATADDGVIEAFELPTHPWLIAVQWHPELMAEQDPLQQRIFNTFIDKAKAITHALKP